MEWNSSHGTIILYNPIVGLFTKQDKGNHRFNYSLWSLVPGLIEAGFNVQVIDGRVDDVTPLYNSLTGQEKPLFIGISCMTGTQLIDAMRVAKKIREISPKTPIVWGGWHVTLAPQSSIKEDFVDYVITGRGEEAIVELANRLSDPKAEWMIPGLWEKCKDGCSPVCATSRPIHEVFPEMPWELIDINKYSTNFGYSTSTGCAWRCSFCAIQQIYKSKMFYKPMDQVIRDLKYIVDHLKRLSFLIIDDDLFFIKKDRLIEFCEKWNHYRRVPMFALGHVNVMLHFDKSLWDMIVKAGFFNILIGAESGSQAILNKLKKHQTPDKIFQFVERSAQYNIACTLSCITGFPDTSIEDDFKDTIMMIQKAGIINPSTDWKLFFIKPFAGTELFYEFQKLGYKMPSTMKEWADYNLRSVGPWTSHELEDAVNFFVYYFFPKVAYHYTWDSFVKAFEEARCTGPIHHLGGF